MASNQKSNRKITPKKTVKRIKKTPTTKKSSTISDPYFNSIFNNASVGILLMDLNNKIIRTNKAFQRFIDYTQEELSSLTISEITHHDDYKIDEKLFNEVVDGKRNEYTIDKRYLTKDGRTVRARKTISSIYDPKQKKKRIIALVEDITRQQQFETKFSLEQNFLTALLENNPDAIYFKDLNSRFLKISRALAKKLNVQPDDLVGKTDFDVFGVDHASAAYKDEQEIIKTGIPIIGKEEREDWADGRTAWVSTSKMPFYDKEGKLIGTFGISRDITIKKRTEQSQEALFRISETAFTAPDMQTLFKKIHDVVGTLMPAKNLFIALYDEKNDLLTFPYHVDQYVKLRESSKPGRGMTEYVLRTSHATLIDQRRLEELTDSGKIEVIGIPPKIWLGVPLKLYGKTIGVIGVQDYEKPMSYGESEMQIFTFVAEQIALVIERKRSSDEIAQYVQELGLLNQTKDKFFSIIAHDLKNPFITILGFSDLLLSDYKELSDEERIFYIQEMKESANLSHDLLQNLLQWSRSQTGRIEFIPKKLELSKVIDENFLLLNKTAEKKQIQLKHKIATELNINADEDMLNSVVRNLLTNAIKFSNKGGIIFVDAIAKGEFVEINVADAGIGMDKKTVENLFRLDLTHSTIGTGNESGTGLGLILCREFIEKHGGRIRVESELGKGSKFIFTIPKV